MVKVDDYEIPEGLYYSKDYMWVKIEGERARIGITDYAQKQLREVVYAELPDVGDELVKDEPFGTLESVKAVSDLVAPLSGKVEEVNEEVTNSPEIVNEDPYNKGWLVIMTPSEPEEEIKTLMDFEAAVDWHKELIAES
ncbi:MAG: glycine cleavage system protein GcvH [Candidatus Bathyarchaeia archaeon]